MSTIPNTAVVLVAVVASLASIAAAEVPPPEPDVFYTPHETSYGAYYVPGNLLVEGTSFETGADAALDGGWYWAERRSYVRWLDAGEGDLYLTTHEPPRVVPTPAPVGGVTHSGRCLELRMRNRSVPYVVSRPFLVPATGLYTLSIALRTDPSAPSGQRPEVNMHIRKYPQGNLVANRGPAGGTTWTRESVTTGSNLEPGQWYQVVLYMGAWDSARDYPDQSVWIDAVMVAPAPSTTYVHPTAGWELGARVVRYSVGQRYERAAYDTFWVGEDDGFRRLAVDVYAAGLVPEPVTLTVNLYDSRGSQFDPQTRVATYSRSVVAGAGTVTYLIDLEPLLSAAGNAPGFYLAECLLTDATGAPVDRQASPFMVLHRAPPSVPDPELSPFGGHPQMIMSPYRNEIWDFWYGYGVEINAAPSTMLTFLRDVGVRWTREFLLCNYDVRTYYNFPPELRDLYWPPSEYWDNPAYVPPIFTEYAELLASLALKTVPTFWARTA